VGLVWIGLAGPRGSETARRHFIGDRETIRMLAARGALDRLRRSIARGH
jgi:nicotinamide mononucleotide (NMN) deamidase PncC